MSKKPTSEDTSFAQALEQLEAILLRIEGEETDIDQLAAELRDGRAKVGIASAAGLRFFKARVEIYLEVTPRLMLLPRRDAYAAAGVGFRIYP